MLPQTFDSHLQYMTGACQAWAVARTASVLISSGWDSNQKYRSVIVRRFRVYICIHIPVISH